MKEKGKKLNIVLAVSLLITLSLVVWAAVFPDNYAYVATSLLDFFTTKFGWLYTICVGAFLEADYFLNHKNEPVHYIH